MIADLEEAKEESDKQKSASHLEIRDLKTKF